MGSPDLEKDVGEANLGLPEDMFVKDGQVYQLSVGGSPRPVGFVEEGVPYELVCGQKRPMVGAIRFG